MQQTLFTSDDRLYQALLDRDPAFVGTAYVGVTSTGIFCRLDCPAKKPKRENCQFYPTVADCLDAGFRACKRCKPLDPVSPHGVSDPVVGDLLAAVQADPHRLWCESDLTDRGLDPSTVRRAFKRQFGMTFLAYARRLRLHAGIESLEGGASVIDAQLESGFASPSGFRDAVAKLMGLAPGAFSQRALLRTAMIDTDLGPMVTVTDSQAVHLLEFHDRKGLAGELVKLYKRTPGGLGFGRTAVTDRLEAQLHEFFAGQRNRFDLATTMHGTDFQKRVWRALQDIPAGETRSYGALAATIGNAKSVRAVARANGANQLAILVPCHRVIGADGSMTGYAGGVWRKSKLIALEAHYGAYSA